jgi:site-specific recombinase XerD
MLTDTVEDDFPTPAWIQEYIGTVRGGGPDFKQSVVRHLQRFEAYAWDQQGRTFLHCLDRTDLLREYVQIPAFARMAPATRATAGFSLRGFTAWLLREGRTVHDVYHYVALAQIVLGQIPEVWLQANLQVTILAFERQLRQRGERRCVPWVQAAHHFNLFRNRLPGSEPREWLEELARSTSRLFRARQLWVGLEHFLEFWLERDGQGQDWLQDLRSYRSRTAVLRVLMGPEPTSLEELRKQPIPFHSGLAVWLAAFLEHRTQRRMWTAGLFYELQRLDRIAAEHQIQTPEQLTCAMLLDYLSDNDPAPATWNGRLAKLRGLARFLGRRGRKLTLPGRWLGRTPPAFRPHLFTLAEIGDLLATLRSLGEDDSRVEGRARGRRRCSFRWCGIETIVFLLYACGLRLREPVRLRVGDVDLNNRLLFLNDAKFYKQRWVPFGLRAAERLSHYRELRSEHVKDDDPQRAFFLTASGRPIRPQAVEIAFRQALERLGLTCRGTRQRPRLHDLRHTLAVHKLYQWYSEGADVQNKLPLLSTYLGHDRMHHTEAYLHLTDDLLRQAGGNFRVAFEQVVGPGLDDASS